MNHVNIRITGKVQGVSFRAALLDKARELGLRGFVRNQPEGSVYAEVEGDEDLINTLIAWCHKGPPGARVERIEVSTGSPKAFEGFEVMK